MSRQFNINQSTLGTMSIISTHIYKQLSSMPINYRTCWLINTCLDICLIANIWTSYSGWVVVFVFFVVDNFSSTQSLKPVLNSLDPAMRIWCSHYTHTAKPKLSVLLFMHCSSNKLFTFSKKINVRLYLQWKRSPIDSSLKWTWIGASDLDFCLKFSIYLDYFASIFENA